MFVCLILCEFLLWMYKILNLLTESATLWLQTYYMYTEFHCFSQYRLQVSCRARLVVLVLSFN